MLDSLLGYFFTMFTYINSLILSAFLLPISNAIFIFFPIEPVVLFNNVTTLFNQILSYIEFISVIFRQLTCISPFMFNALIIFFTGKFSILLFKLATKFLISVLHIFHINLPYYLEDHNEIGFKTK